MSFKEAMKNVMKSGGYGKDVAAAIVAEASRNASPEAKRRNPKLNRVKGKSSSGGKKAAPKKKAASKKKPAPKKKAAKK